VLDLGAFAVNCEVRLESSKEDAEASLAHDVQIRRGQPMLAPVSRLPPKAIAGRTRTVMQSAPGS
jgi:hypothetical protein